MNTYLEFEKPIEPLDNRILELKRLNENTPSESLLEEITKVEQEINDTYEKIFSNITPWQRTLISRHPDRPKTKDYIESLQNTLNFGMSFNQYKKWVEKSVLYDPGVIPENESIH